MYFLERKALVTGRRQAIAEVQATGGEHLVLINKVLQN
jgi:hypothetical protein